ncbi:MAG TPA: ATP-binding protein [Thermoanaerobaculia bacterium]|jgi:type II secretory pathway predicted ATPase ExeA|nr:ATP-binding protein [Thermoanaerobaculia bacterium]
MTIAAKFKNPFRPGAGHMPPYLAGRDSEQSDFKKLLQQEIILQNLVLTGLRGVGKTVLLETFKPLAIQEGWLWVGADLSESASISEAHFSTRILTDLAVVTSSLPTAVPGPSTIGFSGTTLPTLNFAILSQIYKQTPGLVADKIKAVLETVWEHLKQNDRRGLIFAYDEAQNLSDHASVNEFPLSILLDVFQSIQKKEIPFMLALTGLPTLFPKLVEARTFSERMFRVLFLDQLDTEDSHDAILKPIQKQGCPISFDDSTVTLITDVSGGYPYLIQFICREIFDVWIQKIGAGENPMAPMEAILRKLDTDFFAGRWARATDRQRDLLTIAARLPNSDSEFTVQELVEESKRGPEKPFGSSHVNQMLAALSDAGLVYKNRHGRYSFAVPLLNRFILRQGGMR